MKKIIIILLSLVMVYFINQKEGFHEDEIFSYGSSNYKYGNMYSPYGYTDWKSDVFYTKIVNGSLKDYISFFKNKYAYDSPLKNEVPIFKDKEEANYYLSIQKEDIFNFFAVYYNQTVDVHPPLFYFLVHIISCFFYNCFSKYIIFILNLVFFILSLITIDKIMIKLDKKDFSIPTMLLYGLSMGGISTVIFQRMYIMLTFFCLLYLYLNICFIKGKYNKFYLCIVLGFLTHYHFAIYAVLIFTIVSIYLIYNKKYDDFFKYFKIHLLSVIIAIVLFPASIYHIFFSYRGINNSQPFLNNLVYFIKECGNLYSINLLFIIIILFILNKKDLISYLLFIPIILFILIISKTAPFLGINYTSRYIYLLLPIIAIDFIYLSSKFLNFKWLTFLIIVISIIGFKEPTYLFKGYNQALDLARSNSDKYFVYVYDDYFTHLKAIEEFGIYKKSLIVNKDIYDFKLDYDVDEFILCIKNYLNEEEILEKIINNSSYNSYETILKLDSFEANYYLVKR